MTTHENLLTTNEILSAKVSSIYESIISCLDLERLSFLVQNATAYDDATVQMLIERYAKWLSLKMRYKNQSIVPTTDIDIVWHQHILDTERYAIDCLALFGEFLHHRPHLKGDTSLSGFVVTKSLWQKHFNEEMIGEVSICD